MVLPASMRLKGQRCFDHLHRNGNMFHSSLMTIRVVGANPKFLKQKCIQVPQASCRCAVAISSKVNKKSVERNKLRRLLHQHLRQRLENAPENASNWALLTLKPKSSSAEHPSLLEECDRLLVKAGLLK